MYSIYADGACIYDDTYNEVEYVLTAPTLKLADNSAGSLEFTLPTTNVAYNTIQRMKTTITVMRDGEEIWEGRVLKEDRDFYNNKKITCEGELSYLNDTTQPPHEYHDTLRSFLLAIIREHNSKASSDKQFELGAVTVTDPNDYIYRYTNRESTLQVLNDKLVSRLGGHLRIRKVNGVRTLDYLADYPKTSDQAVNFGENLLDYAAGFDMSKFATVVLPLGAQLEESEIETLTAYTTVESVNNGSPYVMSSAAVNQYGWIETVVHWDDVTQPSNLLTKATQYLSSIQFDDVTLKLTVLDLHYLDPTIQPFDLLDQVRCVSEPHGLDRYFPVTEMTIQLDHPENSKYKLGTTEKKSLSATTKASNKAILDLINSLPTEMQIDRLIDEAKDNATALITAMTNGYVTIVMNNGHAAEFLITDNADYTVAQKVWRWNLNGLGYSKTGYNGTYGTAITMDGSIVADYITTGTLNARLLRAGRIQDLQGNNYWDLETGEFSLSPGSKVGNSTLAQYTEQFAEDALEDAKKYSDQNKANTTQIVKTYADQVADKAVQEAQSNADKEIKKIRAEANTNLNTAKTYARGLVNTIQKQVDGAIETWYYNYQPTLTNAPANSWKTETVRKVHEGDVFYWKDKGFAYRFMKDGNTWKWILIKDSDLTTAIAKANAAQKTADTKIKTYAQNTAPSSGMKAGDLWIKTNDNNRLYRYNGKTWIDVRDKMIATANTAASLAQKAADKAKTDITNANKLIKSMQAELGHNILRGTNTTTSLTSSGLWRYGLWRKCLKGNGTATYTNVNGSPQPNMFAGWSLNNASTSNYVGLAQDEVRMRAAKYTLSCYAKGTGRLVFQYGWDRYQSKGFTLSGVSKWQRYTWTFTASTTNSGGKYLIKNGLSRIYFLNKGVGTITITGLQLELGSTVHNYVESSEEGAIGALKESMTQQQIFNTLTQNGQTQGVYLKNGKLYINASYIASGTLSANYVRTGLITDKKGLSSWNLNDGVMKLKLQSLSITTGKFNWTATHSSMTNSGVISADSVNLSGTIKTGSNTNGHLYSVLSGGSLAMYKDAKFVGSIRGGVMTSLVIPGEPMGTASGLLLNIAKDSKFFAIIDLLVSGDNTDPFVDGKAANCVMLYSKKGTTNYEQGKVWKNAITIQKAVIKDLYANYSAATGEGGIHSTISVGGYTLKFRSGLLVEVRT